MKKIYAWFIGLLEKIRRDRLYHFICGFIIAAFFGISLGMKAWAVVPALFAGLIKEFIDQWVGGEFDWWDVLATVLGGLVITACYLLALLFGF